MATVHLSEQTRALLDAETKRGGFTDAEHVLRLGLEALRGNRGEDYEDRDADTRAAIAAAEEEHRQGLGRPWVEVREELLAEFAPRPE